MFLITLHYTEHFIVRLCACHDLIKGYLTWLGFQAKKKWFTLYSQKTPESSAWLTVLYIYFISLQTS